MFDRSLSLPPRSLRYASIPWYPQVPQHIPEMILARVMDDAQLLLLLLEVSSSTPVTMLVQALRMAVVVDDLLCYAYESGTHGTGGCYNTYWIGRSITLRSLNHLVVELNALMGGV